MSDFDAVATAALWASIHNLRILVNRGLVHSSEVDEFQAAVREGLQEGSPEAAAVWETQLGELFADLKGAAESTWLGRQSEA